MHRLRRVRAVHKSFALPPEGAEGLYFAHGFAYPMLIALAVGAVMTFVATRMRFGRYVYAIGGNPEAAELAGVNTRLITTREP